MGGFILQEAAFLANKDSNHSSDPIIPTSPSFAVEIARSGLGGGMNEGGKMELGFELFLKAFNFASSA